MKRVLFLALGCAVVGVIVLSNRTPQRSQKSQETTNETQSITKRPTSSQRTKTEPTTGDPDLARLKDAVRQGNYGDVEAVMVTLTYYLKERPELLNEILESLATETNPNYLTQLAKVIEDGGALTNKAVTEAALNIARNDSLSAQRHTALALLGKIPEVSTETSDSIRELALQAADPQVRTSAIATMANWMNDHPERSIDWNSDLLKISNSSDSPEIRATALQTIAVHLPGLPGSFTTAMLDHLEGDPFSRAIAARALGNVPQSMTTTVLPKLQQAFRSETETEIKRTLLSSIVQTGRNNLNEILQPLATDPTLGRDVQDYLEILARGINDPAELQREKNLLEERRASGPAVAQ